MRPLDITFTITNIIPYPGNYSKTKTAVPIAEDDVPNTWKILATYGLNACGNTLGQTLIAYSIVMQAVWHVGLLLRRDERRNTAARE